MARAFSVAGRLLPGSGKEVYFGAPAAAVLQQCCFRVAHFVFWILLVMFP